MMKNADRRSFLAAAASGALAMSCQRLAAVDAQPSGPQRIRVGQIGTRHAHASGKMDTFRKFPERFEVVGVVEPDADQRQRMESSASYRGLTWMTEEQLLQQPDLKAVAVETDIDHLLPTAERCIDAGLHIHLDKPAGTSLPHFQRICRKADAAGKMIQMGYMFRSNPAFRFLFNAVQQGWLGDVFQVHCEMSKKVGDSVRPSLAQYTGGSMFELGCHLIDAVVKVLGAPDQVHAFLQKTRPEFDQLHDNCLAVFEYSSATATIRSSVVEVDGGRRRQFTVCGSRGTIAIQPLEPCQLTLTLEQETAGFRKGTTLVDLPAAGGRYDGDLLHLANVICGIEQPEYSTRHDMAVQRAVLQASGMPLGEPA